MRPAPKLEEIPFTPDDPQPLLRELPAGEPYPVAALGPIRAAVEAVQGATLAPVAIPAGSALAVASLAVQGFADVETLAGPRPTSLYVLTVAQSGERKSACDEPLMTALEAHQKAAARERAAELTAWSNAHAIWRADREKRIADVKSAKGEKRSAAVADLEAMGPEPAAPPSVDRTMSEPTLEGIAKLFATGQPSLGIFSDEGAMFLGGHAMNADNRQKTAAGLCDLWQGKPIRRTRAGESHFVLYGRRLALHLMVQSGPFRRFLAEPEAADVGLLARCLIAEPPSTVGTRLSALVRRAEAPLAAFADRLRTVLETAMPMDAETRELQPRVLALSPDARSLLARFADEIELELAPGGRFAHVIGTAAKAPEQAARIAGVLALWRDLEAQQLEAGDMADGIALAAFYLSEASRLADASTVSAEIERAERLRQWLREAWRQPEILPSDVLQRAPIRALRESPAARAALALLAAHGHLEPLPPGTVVRGKPRKEAWRIVRSGAHEA